MGDVLLLLLSGGSYLCSPDEVTRVAESWQAEASAAAAHDAVFAREMLALADELAALAPLARAEEVAPRFPDLETRRFEAAARHMSRPPHTRRRYLPATMLSLQEECLNWNLEDPFWD